MGIPRFYGLITEQFPTVSKQISFNRGFTLPNHDGTKIDNLYLDANGILHNCSREVYFPKNPKPRLSRGGAKELPKPSPAKLERKAFEAISGYIDQLLKFVEPCKLFYIAIDGPAPLAKQAQQRQRRYKSADLKSDEELDVFDSTAITPGTGWMYRLSKYIHYYIRYKLTTDPVWRKVKVIFSGSDVPGEGEHKIVQYIRQQKNRNDLVHCMYGLDADLFMLSMSTHCPKFYLLREDQFNTVWNDTLFYKVDIGLLRKEIFDYWGSLGGDQDRLIDDFIFACFLVGNDFLHALPCCHDLADSINYIMDLRKEVLGSSYITKGTSYDLTNLTVLLAHLGKTEEQAISAQYYHQNFPNITVNSSLKDPRKPSLGIDLMKYRELYYKKAGIDHNDTHQVWTFCRRYLQGLEWVQYYYHSKPKNWQWYYPYHYTPLIHDIIDYLTNASSNSRLSRVSNKYLEPILPFQQLLCVVPPRSKALLPKYLQSLYTGALEEYYPTKYKLDLEGKRRDWEAIALLPFIHLPDVVDAYNKVTKRAEKKGIKVTFERNTVGNTVKFWFRPSDKNYTYKSNYGLIRNCPVAYRNL